MFPLVLGLLVGLSMALTGAGGGILAVPLLVFALRLPLGAAAPPCPGCWACATASCATALQC